MRLPKLAPPVKRPDLIYPHRSVDVVNGRVEDIVGIRIDLLHAANYNDPAPFEYRNCQSSPYGGGCYGMHYGAYF